MARNNCVTEGRSAARRRCGAEHCTGARLKLPLILIRLRADKPIEAAVAAEVRIASAALNAIRCWTHLEANHAL